MRIDLEHVPPEIRASTRAVVWRRVLRDGKWTKPPFQARHPGEPAAVDDPATWRTFEQALAVVAAGKADGAGIVLGDGLVGVDLDHVRDPESGALTVEAAEIVRALDSYTEVSPSGTGLHILLRGTLPPGGRRKGAVEMYAEGRYFTVTGQQHLAVEAERADVSEFGVECFQMPRRGDAARVLVVLPHEVEHLAHRPPLEPSRLPFPVGNLAQPAAENLLRRLVVRRPRRLLLLPRLPGHVVAEPPRGQQFARKTAPSLEQPSESYPPSSRSAQYRTPRVRRRARVLRVPLAREPLQHVDASSSPRRPLPRTAPLGVGAGVHGRGRPVRLEARRLRLPQHAA
jgi:hypothetical protein